MKLKKLTKLAFALCAGTFLMAASESQAVLITSVGINVTNNGTSLVADVPQSVLGNQNPSTQFAWLDSLVGEPYNTIASASLPEPTGDPSTPYIQDDNASENGTYTLSNGLSYYIVAHYGQSNTAWYIASADGNATYGMPNQASAFGGAGRGLSNVRIWEVERTNSVPEGGASVALLGLALGGLGAARRFMVKKA
jgi:hypothetical protein